MWLVRLTCLVNDMTYRSSARHWANWFGSEESSDGHLVLSPSQVSRAGITGPGSSRLGVLQMVVHLCEYKNGAAKDLLENVLCRALKCAAYLRSKVRLDYSVYSFFNFISRQILTLGSGSTSLHTSR